MYERGDLSDIEKKTNDQNLTASSYVECSLLREFDSEY